MQLRDRAKRFREGISDGVMCFSEWGAALGFIFRVEVLRYMYWGIASCEMQKGRNLINAYDTLRAPVEEPMIALHRQSRSVPEEGEIRRNPHQPSTCPLKRKGQER